MKFKLEARVKVTLQLDTYQKKLQVQKVRRKKILNCLN